MYKITITDGTHLLQKDIEDCVKVKEIYTDYISLLKQFGVHGTGKVIYEDYNGKIDLIYRDEF